MKPERRRLLIPGLLIALLVVVALAATVRRAGAETTPLPVVPHTQVCVMSDPRITESSGLAASQAHPGIVYTHNDSGDRARIFAVDIATGRVVGVTSVTHAKWDDAEAMALVNGKIWVADIGSSRPPGADRALYVFDEPGPGNHRVSAIRYPIKLSGGEVETEAIAITPARIFIFSKGWPYGPTFLLPRKLSTDRTNVARTSPIPLLTPAWTADATVSPDGRFVLVRGVVQVQVRDARTWELKHVDVIPILRQGETIAMEAGGESYLIGSEGSNSPLVRIAFDPTTFTAPPPAVDQVAQIRAQRPVRTALRLTEWKLLRHAPLVLLGGGAIVIAGGVWWTRRKRRLTQSPS
jgi:hypothetical protein